MRTHRERRLGAAALLALALALMLAGCGKNSTAPLRTHSIAGTVRDANGAVVSGAHLALENEGPIAGGMSFVGRTETDAEGRFTFGALASGSYRIGALLGDQAVATRFTLPFAAAGALTLTLADAGRLVGTVRYSGSSAHQTIAVDVPFDYVWSWADTNGAWVADNVPAGTWQITATHYAATSFVSAHAIVNVTAGVTTVVPPMILNDGSPGETPRMRATAASR